MANAAIDYGGGSGAEKDPHGLYPSGSAKFR
jgi:hypothetical protein